MKIRYRNASSLEIRDVDSGSNEEKFLFGEVFTVGGESRPMWITEIEYRRQVEDENLQGNRAPEEVTFGGHQRRLTPGEVEMGIKSYDHKEAMLRGHDAVDAVEGDDEEEEEDDPESETVTKAPPRASRRRPGKRSVAGGRSKVGTGSQSGTSGGSE